MAQELRSLQQLLERIDEAAHDRDRVSIAALMAAVGNQSFGPLLLLAGTVLFSPLSGIPGMPTTMAVFVLLIAMQLLLRKDHFWLPQWLLKRSIASSKLHKAVNGLARPARAIDRWERPRLTFFTRAVGVRIIALFCVLIAMGTPAMEVVPFSATIAGAAIAVFGLSLIARDGLLALFGLIASALVISLIVYTVFG